MRSAQDGSDPDRRLSVKPKVYGPVAALLGVFLMAVPALAHHALQAEYDTSKRGGFTGTLTRFALINPHVRWFFDVKKPDGTVVKWEVTAGGPAILSLLPAVVFAASCRRKAGARC